MNPSQSTGSADEKRERLRGILGSWGIILILIGAALLRFYRLGFVNLEGHTESLVNTAHDLVYRGGHPGYFLPLGNFGHYGPILVYLFAPVMALTKSPYSVFVFTIVLHLAATYLLYRLIADFFGRRGALVAAFLYAFSFYSLAHSRLASPENLLPFFVLLFMYSLFAIRIQGRTLYYIPLFASCAVFLQIHVTAFPLVLLLPLLFFSRPPVKWAPVLAGLAILAAAFLPYGNYEWKNDFKETKEMVRVVTGRSDLSHKLRSTLGDEPEPLLDLVYLRRFLTLEENPVHFIQELLLCPSFEGKEGLGALRMKAVALTRRIKRITAWGVFALFASGLAGLIFFTGLCIARPRSVGPGDGFASGSILAWFFLSLLLLLFLPYQSHTHLNGIYLSMLAVLGASAELASRLARGRAGPWVWTVLAVIAPAYAAANALAYLHATDLGARQNCIAIKSAEAMPLEDKMRIGEVIVENFHPYLREAIKNFYDIPFYGERLSYLTGMPIILAYYLDRSSDSGRVEPEGGRPIFLILKSSNQPYPRPRALFLESVAGYEVIGAVPLIERTGWRYSNREEPGWQEPGFDDAGWAVSDLPTYICLGSTFSGDCPTFSDYAPFFWRGWMNAGEPGPTSLLFLGVYGFHLSELYVNGRPVQGLSSSADREAQARIVEIGGELVPGRNLIAVKYAIKDEIRPAETNVFSWDLFDISSASSPETGRGTQAGTNSLGD